MNSFRIILLLAVSSLVLTGCKIVKQTAESEAVIAADASGDDARTAIRIEETFESQLIPHIANTALSPTDLRAEVTADLDLAGDKHGNRGSGQGAAWNFAVTGTGIVIESKLESRARWVKLDTDADGTADTTLQLGPVIKGNALRDVAPFYNFDDFRDQIEFAKLGRALNDQISGSIELPEGDLIGATVNFTGVVALKSADDAFVVTPTSVEVSE